MNHYGIERSRDLVAGFAARWNLPMPATLADQARNGQPFSFTLVRSDIADGVATLTINRPDAMNALNEDVVAQLEEAFHAAAADPLVKGIVIAGSGKAFVAGADIRFFVRHIEAGTIDAIAEFTERGQALLRAFETCPKPVIARLHGLALGGGVELALACHAIVATPKASLAFPETGIGIYPGLGGTQRTTRRVGPGLAKWLVLSGQTIGAEEALAIGLVDMVVPYEQLDAAIREIIAAGPSGRSCADSPCPTVIVRSPTSSIVTASTSCSKVVATRRRRAPREGRQAHRIQGASRAAARRRPDRPRRGSADRRGTRARALAPARDLRDQGCLRGAVESGEKPPVFVGDSWRLKARGSGKSSTIYSKIFLSLLSLEPWPLTPTPPPPPSTASAPPGSPRRATTRRRRGRRGTRGCGSRG